MKARDVMVSPVITVKPYTEIRHVANTLLENRISAVPVVNDDDELVGIVSDGDLIHREEAETQRHRPKWLHFLASNETLAAEYVRARGRKAVDVMTKDVVTASPDTPLYEIAGTMEKHAIKRVPIVVRGRLVGIVARADLIQAVASHPRGLEVSSSDAAIRVKLLAHLREQPWARGLSLNVTVVDGVVTLWGMANSKSEKDAVRVAAESMVGVRTVNDNITLPVFMPEPVMF